MNKVFLILFILFFSEYNQALCEEIKLRFKEIRIKFEPEKKSNIENVKKIENFLKNYLITKGDAKDFFLTITIKKYDVLVRKEKPGKELIKQNIVSSQSIDTMSTFMKAKSILMYLLYGEFVVK